MAIPRIVIHMIVSGILLIQCMDDNSTTNRTDANVAQNQSVTNNSAKTNGTAPYTDDWHTNLRLILAVIVFCIGIFVIICLAFVEFDCVDTKLKQCEDCLCFICDSNDGSGSDNENDDKNAERLGPESPKMRVDLRNARRRQRTMPEPIAEVDDEREPTTPVDDLSPANAARSLNIELPSPGSDSLDDGPIEMQVQVDIEPKPASPERQDQAE